ncbi:nucleotidyltransferase domain-containing protein [Nocardioides sp. C4-1]|uniref:nucleotidyltransferase domain-containing protein n=1 Tax=Nocardioides sp. C4-1 TaxID=3151851 RepID=UPI003265AB00
MAPSDETAPALDALVGGVRAVLDDGVLGAYLVGSFALGGADEWSDVDVVAAVEAPPDGQSLEALASIHAHLPDAGGWAARLEVSYAVAADLRSPMSLGRRWWHVADGSRELALSADANTAHTRWVLRERGVTLAGPDPAVLVAEVAPDVLRAEALGIARAQAEELEDHLDRLASAWWQPHVVMTACRVLHTAVHADVVGGAAAARSALAVLDPRHRAVVERAVAARPHPHRRRHEPADPGLAVPTRALVWDVVRLAGEAALTART